MDSQVTREEFTSLQGVVSDMRSTLETTRERVTRIDAVFDKVKFDNMHDNLLMLTAREQARMDSEKDSKAKVKSILFGLLNKLLYPTVVGVVLYFLLRQP